MEEEDSHRFKKILRDRNRVIGIYSFSQENFPEDYLGDEAARYFDISGLERTDIVILSVIYPEKIKIVGYCDNIACVPKTREIVALYKGSSFKNCKFEENSEQTRFKKVAETEHDLGIFNDFNGSEEIEKLIENFIRCRYRTYPDCGVMC